MPQLFFLTNTATFCGKLSLLWVSVCSQSQQTELTVLSKVGETPPAPFPKPHWHLLTYVCTDACMHTYTHTCTHTHTHSRLHTHTCMHTHINMHLHMHGCTNIHRFMHAHMHMLAHTYACIHTHTRTHKQGHTCAYAQVATAVWICAHGNCCVIKNHLSSPFQEAGSFMRRVVVACVAALKHAKTMTVCRVPVTTMNCSGTQLLTLWSWLSGIKPSKIKSFPTWRCALHVLLFSRLEIVVAYKIIRIFYVHCKCWTLCAFTMLNFLFKIPVLKISFL